jgi:hypothetical protein
MNSVTVLAALHESIAVQVNALPASVCLLHIDLIGDVDTIVDSFWKRRMIVTLEEGAKLVVQVQAKAGVASGNGRMIKIFTEKSTKIVGLTVTHFIS